MSHDIWCYVPTNSQNSWLKVVLVTTGRERFKLPYYLDTIRNEIRSLAFTMSHQRSQGKINGSAETVTIKVDNPGDQVKFFGDLSPARHFSANV